MLAAEKYVFEGWFTDATCTTKYVKSVTAITSDITLYAKFTGASFEHEKADGTKTYFTSLSGAFAKGSGTIKMLKDSTVSTRITIQNSIGQPVNNIILDLGGKTLTNTVADATYRAILIHKSNSLTVKNGTINFTAGDGFYLNNGHLTLDNDVDINATNHTAVVIVKGSTLTTAADINSGSDFAIAGNGTDGNGNTTVNVNGGTITSDVIAIYQPQSGALNISDGIITGSTAVYAKSGTTNITGGTLIGNGEKVAYNPMGDGASATGDALVIDNCGYPGGVPEVSITGGIFNSTHAKAVGSYANGELSPITGFITGGTFSSDPTAYVDTSSYRVVDNDDGTYTVVNSEADEFVPGTYTITDAIVGTEIDVSTAITGLPEGATAAETLYTATEAGTAEVDVVITFADSSTTTVQVSVTAAAAPVDKAALTSAIDAEYSDGDARTTYELTEADYTEATWTAYITAISDAITVEENAEADQAAVDAAAAAIGTAKGNLVFAGKADLDAAKAEQQTH